MFDNIIGHEFQKKIFSESNTYRPSYIFEGPVSIGKFTMAKEIALFHGGIQQNVHIVDKDAISVDDIRAVCEEVQVFPYMNKHRTVIINDAEKMNEVSQNTLLKTLETPPNNCHFILITTDTSLLLKTIVSRCTVCKFDFVSPDDVRKTVESELHVKDKGLLNFITVCVRGSIGRIFQLNGDISYYQNLFSVSEKLSKERASKYVLDITEMFSIKTPTTLFCELIDIGSWFIYEYLNTREDRFSVYSKIVSDTLSKVGNGGSAMLATELMCMRILKHNDVLSKRQKREV